MSELYHYGVKGMKWGVRKEYESHPREKAKVEDKTKRTGLSDKAKRRIVIGAAAAATVLAAYGLYRIGAFDKFISIGKNSIDNGATGFKLKTKPSLNTVESLMEDVLKVNPGGGDTNCVGCSIGLEMRRRGYDTNTFKDYPSALKQASTYTSVFKDLKFENIDNVMRKKDNKAQTIWALSKYPNGARGTIIADVHVGSVTTAHAFSWEKIDGVIHFVDGQKGIDYTKSGRLDWLFNIIDPGSISYARLDELELLPMPNPLLSILSNS